MRIATATLSSAAPYSPSRSYDHEVEKLQKETHEAYETRTWRNKCHVTPDGTVFIPPMAFKMAVDSAASSLGHQIPGRGKKTYTKFFLSGVLVMEPITLGIRPEETAMDRIFCNADGKRNSGSRVWRNFPRIEKWTADVPFHVLADEITNDEFEETLKHAGAFVGVGRFRPQNGGFYGRFEIKKIKWN